MSQVPLGVNIPDRCWRQYVARAEASTMLLPGPYSARRPLAARANISVHKGLHV
jgi:hypothetical protein